MRSVPFFTTLRSRALALAILTAVPPLVVMLSLAVQWRGHEVRDAQENAREVVHRAAALHEHELQEGVRLLAALEPLARALPAQTEAGMAWLGAVLDAGSPGENIGVFTPDGELLASARPADHAGLAARPFFARAVRTGRVAVDAYAIELKTGTAAFALAYPVLGASARVERVVLRILDVSSFREFSGLPDGTIATVFDDAGAIVAQHPPAPTTTTRSTGRAAIFHRAIEADAEGTTAATVFDDAPRAFVFAPLGGSDPAAKLFVSLEVPVAGATARADRILKTSLLRFSVAIGGVMLLAWVAGDRLVVRHVQALARAARRLGRGEMDARVGTARRPAELAQLAATFDHMAEALQSREREVIRQRDQLAVQERRFRSILENSSEGVSLRDAAGTLLYVSPSNARILGYEPDEVIGQNSDDFIHPDDCGRMKALHAEVMARPGVVISASFRLRHKDGTWRWVAKEMKNLLADPAVGGILGNYQDVTADRNMHEALRRARDELEQRVRERTDDLEKANEALRGEVAERKRAEETLQKLSSAMEQTADSVFVTDREGTIEYVNPSFEALTGYTRTEAIGKTPRLFSSGLHDRRFYELLWTTILSGRVFRNIVTNRAKDDRLFDEDQTITPLRDDHGVITHFVSTGRDITERKRTEKALRRLNELLEQETTRIANVLHDEAGQFLTSAHIMLADLARDLPAPTRERVDDVRQHLDHVEQQLRTISRDLHPRILQDLGLIGTIRFRAEAFARRTGIRTSVHAARDYQLAPAVQVAVYRLVQEGLTNAGRYAHAAAVTIALTDDGQNICCSIRDDGAGFDVEEVCVRREEPCLGLQGMRARIEALGGRFEIISARDQGTELRAHLPLEH